MSATGFSWFLGNFVGVGNGAVAWASAHALYLYRGPLFHLVLGYPGGRPSSWLTRAAIGVGYVAAVITLIWRNELATIVLAGFLVAVCAREYVSAVGPSRRARLIALQAAAGLSLVLAGNAVAAVVVPGGAALARLLVYEVALCVIAGGLLAGLLFAPWGRAAVTDLVVQLGRARSGTLRAELAGALGDPALELGYWSGDAGAFVDPEGRVLALPDPGSGRSAAVVERDGHPAAVLIHDSAVLEDPGLLDAVTAAARLGASNARLQAEVQAQIAELAASRRRILEAGDEERQRLERRLHDGAEHRLAELAEILRQCRKRATGQQTRDGVARAEDQLTRTLEELRRLAAGLHPRALSEFGLDGALASLTGGFAVPVEIKVTGSRLAPRVEAAAYFVCAEGLANIAKYASASRAAIFVTSQNARAQVVVEDDGIGGADPARGSGLRGLADRVEALGGTLRVHSPPGGGTRLAAEFPLGGAAH